MLIFDRKPKTISKKTIYRRLTFVLIFLILSGLVLYYTLTTVLDISNYRNLFNLDKINWYWAIALFLFPFAFAIFFAIMQWLFLVPIIKQHYRLSDMLWISFTYNFLVCISPFGFLGEFYKLYLFYKQKIKIEKFAPAILLTSLCFQLFLDLFTIFALTIVLAEGGFYIFLSSTVSFIIFCLIIFGIILDFVYCAFLFSILFSNRAHALFTKAILYVQRFFNRIKSEEDYLAKKEKILYSFSAIKINFQICYSKVFFFISALLMGIILVFFRGMVPIFTFLSLNEPIHNFFLSLAAANMIEAAVTLTPLPSGVGFFEIGYFQLYNNFLGYDSETVKRSLLVIRLTLTFYVVFTGVLFLPFQYFVFKHKYPDKSLLYAKTLNQNVKEKMSSFTTKIRIKDD